MIAIITNIPAPYRIALFKSLSETKDFKFKFFFCASSEANRRWEAEEYLFDFEVLSGFSPTLRKKDGDVIALHINPSILYKLRGFDMIICAGYNYPTALLSLCYSLFFKVPLLLWTEQTLYTEASHSFLLHTIRNMAKMFMLKGARGFIATGTQAKEFLIKHGVNKENIFLSPDAVDTEFFLHNSIKLEKGKEMLKKRLNLNLEKLIVYVGQLIKRKGIIHLLQAYQRILSDFNSIGLLIIGEGVQEEELKRYCQNHNLQNVFFLGYKSPETLIQYLVISNLFVLPTLADVWGLVINEAMACGLPIVTTKQAGASTDLVHNDKNGYVVDAEDIDGLTIAIKQILQNPEKEQQMKIASREIIKNWGINEAVEGFLKAIQYTLSRGNR